MLNLEAHSNSSASVELERSGKKPGHCGQAARTVSHTERNSSRGLPRTSDAR